MSNHYEYVLTGCDGWNYIMLSKAISDTFYQLILAMTSLNVINLRQARLFYGCHYIAFLTFCILAHDVSILSKATGWSK